MGIGRNWERVIKSWKACWPYHHDSFIYPPLTIPWKCILWNLALVAPGIKDFYPEKSPEYFKAFDGLLNYLMCCSCCWWLCLANSKTWICRKLLILFKMFKKISIFKTVLKVHLYLMILWRQYSAWKRPSNDILPNRYVVSAQFLFKSSWIIYAISWRSQYNWDQKKRKLIHLFHQKNFFLNILADLELIFNK